MPWIMGEDEEERTGREAALQVGSSAPGVGQSRGRWETSRTASRALPRTEQRQNGPYETDPELAKGVGRLGERSQLKVDGVIVLPSPQILDRSMPSGAEAV